MGRRVAWCLLALASCTETTEPWCDHGVTSTSSGAVNAVFALKRCGGGDISADQHGVYSIQARTPTLIAREPQSGALGWSPKGIAADATRILLAVHSANGDYAELRNHEGALLAASEVLSVSIFDPFFTSGGGVILAYGAGVVTLTGTLETDGRGVRELRDDIRSIDLVDDELVVASFRGKRVFLFDATVPSELDKISDVIRGATEVALFPDRQRIAVVNPDDQLIEIYDRAFERQSTLATGADPRQVDISDDGARIAVVEGGETSPDSEVRGAVRVYDVATGAELANVPLIGKPTSVALDPTGSTAYVGLMFQGATELNIPGQPGIVALDVASGTVTDISLP